MRQQDAPTVSITQVGPSEWETVEAKAKLSAMPFGFDLEARTGDIQKFQWGDGSEDSQAERFLAHLQGLIGTQNGSFALLNGKTDCHFVADSLAGVVGYKFHGNPDAVLVLHSGRSIPQASLRVVFQIKKEVEDRHICQAKVLLLLANHCCSRMKPIVVLTDLRDEYSFFWADGRTVYVYKPSSAAAAWGFFDSVLRSERFSNEEGAVVLRDTVGDSEAPGPAKRRRLELREEGNGGNSDVATLADLEGFLEPEELGTAQLAQLLQQLERIPALEAAFKDWKASNSTQPLG